ncbi:MAG: hypothetical protein L0H63_05825, partial [Nitrococcus sp.]|nr:hypothetical protein [Nitrococcus sp.]
YRRPRLVVMLLLFSLSLFIPVLGVLGYLLGVTAATCMPHFRREYTFATTAVPKYAKPNAGTQGNHVRMGEWRSQLAGRDAPIELKMKTLLAINNVAPHRAANVLRALLSDHSDDLRLLAFGMLENKIDQIMAGIHQAQENLQSASNGALVYRANKRLAELYLELHYQGLVRNDMRTYTLVQAKRYADEAMRYHSRDPHLWLMSGRIHLLQCDYTRAFDDFTAAVDMGLPVLRVDPYLAEFSFLQHNYTDVRQRMQRFRKESLGQRMMLLANFWVKS